MCDDVSGDDISCSAMLGGDVSGSDILCSYVSCDYVSCDYISVYDVWALKVKESQNHTSQLGILLSLTLVDYSSRRFLDRIIFNPILVSRETLVLQAFPHSIDSTHTFLLTAS